MNLRNNEEALRWLRKVVEDKARKTHKEFEAVVPLATCLYRARRFSESQFYLLKARENGLSLNADCLFYLSANSYELRKWSSFRRYFIKLRAMDPQRAYADSMKQMVAKKHAPSSKYLRLLELAEGLQPILTLPNGTEGTTAVLKLEKQYRKVKLLLLREEAKRKNKIHNTT